MEKDPWNSRAFEVAYVVFGWAAFFFWSCSFYPQVVLNFFRKSVVGLNFNYALLNNTKHTLYLIYNTAMYFSPEIQYQYHQKYGFDQMIPVAANDVAFSIHAVLLTGLLLVQIAVYERGNQTMSKFTVALVSVIWLCIIGGFFLTLLNHKWLRLISIFNSIQVIVAVIKYIPQAFMNFKQKSTEGFSIGNILFDFSGGVTTYAQMVTQSLDQKSWVNFSGNMGKVLLSLVSIFFDVVFMCQHFLLYPSRKKTKANAFKYGNKYNNDATEPLIKISDPPLLANV